MLLTETCSNLRLYSSTHHWMTSNNFLCTLHTYFLWSQLCNCIHIHHFLCCMFQFDYPSNYYSHCIFYILKVVTNVRYMSLLAYRFWCVKYRIFVIFRQAQLEKNQNKYSTRPNRFMPNCRIFQYCQKWPGLPRQFKTHCLCQSFLYVLDKKSTLWRLTTVQRELAWKHGTKGRSFSQEPSLHK